MITKEDAIKEAYKLIGIDWELKSSSRLHVNGWIHRSESKLINFDNWDTRGSWYRPKSLNGLENNNGWIKIESELDLPKITGHYWSYNGKEVLDDYFEYNNYWLKRWKFVTYYQPITKPEPPIY